MGSLGLGTVTTLIATISGDGTETLMNVKVNSGGQRFFGSPGIEAGGIVDSPVDGAGDVVVSDANGKELFNATVVAGANVVVAPVPTGIKGPLKAVTTSHSDGDIVVTWEVKT